jgi:hypothetical protein
VFKDWWHEVARHEYLGFEGPTPAPWVTFYYDPTIDVHHRLPVSIGGLFPAYYLAAQEPADARALFSASLAEIGLVDPPDALSPPGPRGTALCIHLAREWGLHALADALTQAADTHFEPTWDRGRCEFTWGFGLDEEHPRGQHNAAMAAAEVMTEGAWWRLANTDARERFDQPSVTGVDFPDLTLTQAWWDAGRRHLVLATAGRNDAVVGRPTRFRISALGDPWNWVVDAHGAPVTTRVDEGELEVHTTIGSHRLVVRRS